VEDHRLAAVVRAFGRFIEAETHSSGAKEAELAAVQAGLRQDRSQAEAVLLTASRRQQGLWELNSAVLTTTDRALQELDDVELARLRSEQAQSMHPGHRAAHAMGWLRASSRQLGQRVDLTKRVDLARTVRRSGRGVQAASVAARSTTADAEVS